MLIKDEWKERAYEILDEFEEHLSSMPDKGDTTETSQKISLRNAFNNLYANVNGVEDEDFAANSND
jgi:hypothetical protein